MKGERVKGVGQEIRSKIIAHWAGQFSTYALGEMFSISFVNVDCGWN